MEGEGERTVCGLGWLREVVAPHAGECASLSRKTSFSALAVVGNGYSDRSFSDFRRLAVKMRSWSVVAPGVRPGWSLGLFLSNRLAAAFGSGVGVSVGGAAWGEASAV